MKIINVQPGTDEWHQHRADRRYHNASEASVMMGCSKTPRSELVRMAATGDEQEFSQWVMDVLFERGHEVEAMARPIIEKMYGIQLYPVVGVNEDKGLSASFDGLTLLQDRVWECKQWNEEKAKYMDETGDVPDEDKWQIVHQAAVAGVKEVIYTITDGTPERTNSIVWMVYQKEIDQLLASWKQFDEDVANYQHVETAAEIQGERPESLPSLVVEVTGHVTKSNLSAFKSSVVAIFDGIQTDLKTDQDFADAAESVKYLSEVEKRLEAAKAHILGQTQDIDEAIRTITDLQELSRKKRLSLNDLVDKKKKSIRGDIINKHKDALQNHIDAINAKLGGKITVPAIAVDFAGVMKGKKKIDTLNEACGKELARVQVEYTMAGDRILANLEALRAESKGFETLFPDAQALVTTKELEDLTNIVKLRIAEHKEAEAVKEETETAQSTLEISPSGGAPIYDRRPSKQGVISQTKPGDNEIIAVLSHHYKVAPAIIVDWLISMDMEEAQKINA